MSDGPARSSSRFVCTCRAACRSTTLRPDIERGNIIVWEQSLADRVKGQPLAIEAHMEPQSILIRTLTLFAITIGLALATFALAIWWVMRKGRKRDLAICNGQ